MSLISELKRRNVFKVAAAYLALGWVVLQVTDIVVPALNLPPTIISNIVYIGIVGFFLAVFLAWAYELTPEGLKPTDEVDEDVSIRATTGHKINRLIITYVMAPPFRDMLNQPTMKEYINSIGLPEFWRANKWPDFCRPVGDDDYECQDMYGNYP